jgi:hypothetical protein
VRPSEDPEVSSSTSTRRGPARSRAGPATPVRRHPLGSFLTLTFLLSWGYWIPLAVGGGAGSHVPGLLGPALAALIVALFHASLNVVSGTDVGVWPSVVTSVGIIAAAVALLRREAAEAPHGRSP